MSLICTHQVLVEGIEHLLVTLVSQCIRFLGIRESKGTGLWELRSYVFVLYCKPEMFILGLVVEHLEAGGYSFCIEQKICKMYLECQLSDRHMVLSLMCCKDNQTKFWVKIKHLWWCAWNVPSVLFFCWLSTKGWFAGWFLFLFLFLVCRGLSGVSLGYFLVIGQCMQFFWRPLRRWCMTSSYDPQHPVGGFSCINPKWPERRKS